MRTSLPAVLALLVVNDVVLVVLLDANVPTWGLVLGAAVGLSAPIVALAGVATEDTGPASRADLQAELRDLRERVEELEK
ncbi:hypothetical protein [Halobacterium litoreum]|uniref:Uncharacterized protein n=1 Tax=Halobacterium litoreum TaxID=2039234 RepID=A0ABD5NFG6_9EURY|nr:hypothetical protein [Halobacterium litoreum]UHH13087.1 hypothetical protein LT972_13110 [Halobacterium litoreum]